MTAVSAPFRVAGCWLADKETSINRIRYVTMVAWTAELLGIYLMAFSIDTILIYVGLVVRGIRLGTGVESRPTMLGRYFGRKSYGTVDGLRTIVSLPVRFSMPILSGYIYDVNSSYIIAFIMVLVFLLTGISTKALQSLRKN